MTDPRKRNNAALRFSKAGDIWAFFRYNAANIFSGRAFYSLILASLVFLAVVAINLLRREAALTGQNIYDFLLIPALLLVFYPAAFALQSDKDAGMIEVLFCIPDHRYKIWLARYVTLYIITAALLFLLALLCRVGLADFPLGMMVLQLMFPVVLLGSLAFFLAGLTGSGSATGILMIVVVLAFWLFRGQLGDTPWYLFHNPFGGPAQANPQVWAATTLSNRLFFLLASVFLTMMALLRLQKREKLI